MLNPWIILAIVIAFVMQGIVIGKWQNKVGHTEERVEWQAKEVVQVTAANAAIKRINDEARSKEQAHVDAMAALAAQLAKERASNDARRKADAAAIRDGALKLRIATSSICPDSGAAGPPRPAASGSDAAATVELPQQITRDLFDLANDADQVADQLRACQTIIKTDRDDSHGSIR